jgi:DNA-binding transcriptional LysR family regulator
VEFRLPKRIRRDPHAPRIERRKGEGRADTLTIGMGSGMAQIFMPRLFPRLNDILPGVRLELTGFVPYAEVARHVATADVGLVPYEESNGTHCAFVAKAVVSRGALRLDGAPELADAREDIDD